MEDYVAESRRQSTRTPRRLVNAPLTTSSYVDNVQGVLSTILPEMTLATEDGVDGAQPIENDSDGTDEAGCPPPGDEKRLETPCSSQMAIQAMN